MVPLRKCPKCKETVGAQSPWCPRCGVHFRGFVIRRAIKWTVGVALVCGVVGYYVLR